MININHLNEIQNKISSAAKKSNRCFKDIVLIAVTKKISSARINSAFDLGLYCIGESRIQETEKKLPSFINNKPIEVHLIGHLQSNKVKKAIQLYDVIQTVDSIKLAQKLSKNSKAINKTQRIYIQVNAGNDSQKKGFKIEDAVKAAKEISSLDNLKLEGIMMIPPYIKMNKYYREIFIKTKRLRDQILIAGILSCKNLSMGMSRDFEMAIEEGATHIRIGTALFGKRP